MKTWVTPYPSSIWASAWAPVIIKEDSNGRGCRLGMPDLPIPTSRPRGYEVPNGTSSHIVSATRRPCIRAWKYTTGEWWPLERRGCWARSK